MIYDKLRTMGETSDEDDIPSRTTYNRSHSLDSIRNQRPPAPLSSTHFQQSPFSIVSRQSSERRPPNVQSMATECPVAANILYMPGLSKDLSLLLIKLSNEVY